MHCCRGALLSYVARQSFASDPAEADRYVLLPCLGQVACHWFDFVDPAVSLVLAIGIGLSVLPLVRRALP
jgi:hypothetical protein